MFTFVFSAFCGNSFKDVVELKDSFKSWNVIITSFAYENLSLENVYLAQTLPLKIASVLKGYDKHVLSVKEKLGYANIIINGEVLKVRQNIDKLNRDIHKLDLKDYELSLEDKHSDEELSLYKKLEKERKRFKLLSSYNPSDIVFPVEKDIVYLESSSQFSKLFSPVSDMYGDFLKKNSADLLITGSLSEMAGYLYYRIEVFSRPLDRTILVLEGGGSPETLSSQIDGNIDDLISVVLGRKWCSVVVKTNPITANINIGDKYFGTGIYRNDNLLPGKYIVSVDAPGYLEEIIEIDVGFKENKEFEVVLVKDKAPAILINSFPSGADIYLSSLWVGKTPMLISNGGVEEPFLIRASGYADFVDVLNPKVTNMDIVLNSMNFDFNSYIKDKREDFYVSLAGLMFALPISILSYGFYDYYQKDLVDKKNLVNSNNREFQRLTSTMYGINSVFVGSAILASSMVVALVIDMIDYVKVYDER